tara:strand:- start:55444 stop:55683 length:240 start_codon:yes stop_codon:yes gene_type:complete
MLLQNKTAMSSKPLRNRIIVFPLYWLYVIKPVKFRKSALIVVLLRQKQQNSRQNAILAALYSVASRDHSGLPEPTPVMI